MFRLLSFISWPEQHFLLSQHQWQNLAAPLPETKAQRNAACVQHLATTPLPRRALRRAAANEEITAPPRSFKSLP
jgi:hypothetical protein